MRRIKELNRYQKGILILLILMPIVFAVLYPITLSRVGYHYQNTILVPTKENGTTVYSGKIKGEKAEFIVSGGNTVVFNYGDKSYGPYILKEDPTAIPTDKENAHRMKGIEIRCGDEIRFRGAVDDWGSYLLLYNEDGTSYNLGFGISVSVGGEVIGNEIGNTADEMEPSVSTIYRLLNDPELTHKGNASAWFVGVLLCIMNAVSIFFADELFRWQFRFQIRDIHSIEPTDWEITSRYIAWTFFTIGVLVIYIVGLQ